MTKNKIQNNGKAFWVGFMLIASAIPATAQETVEIQYTKDGVSHTVEVNRNIRQLLLSHYTHPDNNGISSITLPAGLTNLEWLDLSFNQLTSLTLPNGLTNLREIHLEANQLTNLVLPEGLTNLQRLYLYHNQLTNLTLPEGLTNLRWLHLAGNLLTNLALPRGLTNLEVLVLRFNDLTSLTLPEGLTNLKILNLFGNPRLTNLALPRGLTNLGLLFFSSYGFRRLTLAEDTAERFAGIDADRGLAYNLGVYCPNVPLKEVILPKRLDGKVFFRGMEDDVYNNLEFLFLEDLRSPRITRAGDALEITWRVGVLQTSAGIEGPWKDVRASSPLRIFSRPSLPAEFFRVRSKEQ